MSTNSQLIQAWNKYSKDDSQHTEAFQSLSKTSKTCTLPLTEMTGMRKLQNRYANVIPYAYNRVKLSVSLDINQDDYINASWIKSPFDFEKRYYIAAQAPTVQTMHAWWKMIWEQKIEIIVMLTDIVEVVHQVGVIPKADSYWTSPQIIQHHNQNTIQVTLLAKTEIAEHLISRTFELSTTKTHETRIVQQIQYIGWRDHQAPPLAEFSELFQFYNFLATKQYSNRILVHCSAGIGRTGTFIVIDLINRLHQYILSTDRRLSEIANTLHLSIENPRKLLDELIHFLRNSRQGMVQTLEQYKFIVDFISFYLNSIKTTTPTATCKELV